MHRRHFIETESKRSQFRDLKLVLAHVPFDKVEAKQHEIQFPSKSTFVQNYGYGRQKLSTVAIVVII